MSGTGEQWAHCKGNRVREREREREGEESEREREREGGERREQPHLQASPPHAKERGKKGLGKMSCR